MYSILVVTTEGLFLRLAAIKFKPDRVLVVQRVQEKDQSDASSLGRNEKSAVAGDCRQADESRACSSRLMLNNFADEWIAEQSDSALKRPKAIRRLSERALCDLYKLRDTKSY
jgi:hypothetical protein